MKKITTLLVFLFSIFVLIGCTNENQNNNKNDNEDKNVSIDIPTAKHETTLNDLENGVIIVRDNKTKNSDLLEKLAVELSNEYKASIVVLNVDNKEDKEELEEYYNRNKEDLDVLEKLNDYRGKFTNITPTKKMDELYEKIEKLEEEHEFLISGESRNLTNEQEIVIKEFEEYINEYQSLYHTREEFINKHFSNALSAYQQLSIGGREIKEEEKQQIYDSLENIVDYQELSVEELYNYISLLMDMGMTPKFVLDERVKSFPSIYVVYEKQIVNKFKLEDGSLPEYIMNDENRLKEFLRSPVGFINFANTKEMYDVRDKIENKEDFVVYFYGNSCDYCNELSAFLNDNFDEENYDIMFVDIYKLVNQQVFNHLHEKELITYHLEGVPAFFAFEDGKEVATLTPQDWISNAESSRVFDKEKFKEFFDKYAKTDSQEEKSSDKK